MIGFSPSFFLFLFIAEFVAFVPLPFAPAIRGTVLEGVVCWEAAAAVAADAAAVVASVVSFAPFMIGQKDKDEVNNVSAMTVRRIGELDAQRYLSEP
ncbi:hypothetical protein F4810DRAFT_664446 [Camillea tinctor]|nr:hypothetical protein F4810DRAFT_664446 [Camillea tinctor]